MIPSKYTPLTSPKKEKAATFWWLSLFIGEKAQRETCLFSLLNDWDTFDICKRHLARQACSLFIMVGKLQNYKNYKICWNSLHPSTKSIFTTKISTTTKMTFRHEIGHEIRDGIGLDIGQDIWYDIWIRHRTWHHTKLTSDIISSIASDFHWSGVPNLQSILAFEDMVINRILYKKFKSRLLMIIILLIILFFLDLILSPHTSANLLWSNIVTNDRYKFN